MTTKNQNDETAMCEECSKEFKRDYLTEYEDSGEVRLICETCAPIWEQMMIFKNKPDRTYYKIIEGEPDDVEKLLCAFIRERDAHSITLVPALAVLPTMNTISGQSTLKSRMVVLVEYKITSGH